MRTKHIVPKDTNTQTTTPTADQTAVENVEPAEKQGKQNKIWECQRCNITITLFVTPSQPPTHVCRKAANKTKPLTQKGKQ